jgi:hypothetical protein
MCQTFLADSARASVFAAVTAKPAVLACCAVLSSGAFRETGVIPHCIISASKTRANSGDYRESAKASFPFIHLDKVSFTHFL